MTCLAAFTLVALAVHSAEPPRFERDVKPILVAKCVKCHGGETTKSGLDLRTASAIRQGGDTGPSVLSNDPSKSLLFEQITSGAMPPGKAVKLTPAETATIKAWIEAGAKADEPDSSAAAKTPTHWAFLPPKRPAVPSLSGVQHPLDAFLLKALQEKGLTFSPEAERLATAASYPWLPKNLCRPRAASAFGGGFGLLGRR